MNNNIIFLKDVWNYYKDSLDFSELSPAERFGHRTPAGLKYNCLNCKKILFTGPYGSYEYCQSCYYKWQKKPKPSFKINNEDIDFID